MISQEIYEHTVKSLASVAAEPENVANIVNNQAILADYGIKEPVQVAHFLAQTCHESGGFKIAVENLHYSSAPRLHAIWPRHFESESSAEPYVNQPEKLANLVYANRMGNGAPESGDGFRYRGRGMIQLTGKAAYDHVGRLIKLDLVGNPDLAASADHALLVACGTWKFLGVDELSADDPVEKYTRKINGGLIGIDDRKRLFEKAKRLLGL